MTAPVVSESKQLGNILAALPDTVAQAVRDYAENTGLSESQVLELAIASFLDIESPTFESIDSSKMKTYGEMKSRLDFLETMWASLKEGKLSKQTINQAKEMGW